MVIVYTYKDVDYDIYTRKVNQKQWFNKSVKSAKRCGYTTLLFTNSTEFSTESEVDQIIRYKDSSQMWDSAKIEALNYLKDEDYILSDNDILHKNILPENKNTDVIFDGYENMDKNWDWIYKKPVEYIQANSILKSKPYWKVTNKPVPNVGILSFNNSELRQRYIKEWMDVSKKVENLPLSKTTLTATCTQYLLGLLIEKYTTKHYSENIGMANEYYHHYAGNAKFKTDKYLI